VRYKGILIFALIVIVSFSGCNKRKNVSSENTSETVSSSLIQTEETTTDMYSEDSGNRQIETFVINDKVFLTTDIYEIEKMNLTEDELNELYIRIENGDIVIPQIDPYEEDKRMSEIEGVETESIFIDPSKVELDIVQVPVELDNIVYFQNSSLIKDELVDAYYYFQFFAKAYCNYYLGKGVYTATYIDDSLRTNSSFPYFFVDLKKENENKSYRVRCIYYIQAGAYFFECDEIEGLQVTHSSDTITETTDMFYEIWWENVLIPQ